MRDLTPELRKTVGLPPASKSGYRWSFVGLSVALAAIPLLLAGMGKVLAVIAFVALVGVPFVRWLEHGDAIAKEKLFREGLEAWASVLEVEPGGDNNKDRPVHLELWVDGAPVKAVVRGSPLARRGLEPGADVRVVYQPGQPHRCLILEKGARPVVDAVFD